MLLTFEQKIITHSVKQVMQMKLLYSLICLGITQSIKKGAKVVKLKTTGYKKHHVTVTLCITSYVFFTT